MTNLLKLLFIKLKFLHIRPRKIKVPCDIADIKEGTVMTADELFERISDYELKLEIDYEEAASLIDNLQTEIDVLRDNVKEFYRPVDPYEYNGVRHSDFY